MGTLALLGWLAAAGALVIAGAFFAALQDALDRESDLVVKVDRLEAEADANQDRSNDLQSRLSRRRQPSIRTNSPRRFVPPQREGA